MAAASTPLDADTAAAVDEVASSVEEAAMDVKGIMEEGLTT